MSNHHFQNDNLSLRAMGLLSYKYNENRTVIKIYAKEIHFCGRREKSDNVPKGLEGMTNVTDAELEELSLEDDLPF